MDRDFLTDMQRDGVIERLWRRDAALFSSDEGVRDKVADRLGWLGLPDSSAEMLPELAALTDRTVAEGVTDIVLLGMGGSSLAPLVLSRILGGTPGHARPHVLDTTSPAAVRRVLAEAPVATTRFVVASKSGTTIEPLSLYAVFREWADEALGRAEAGQRFLAITDPGSPLAEMAGTEGFSEVFLAPPDVGGRFSALSVFGLVPAAMLGIDLSGLLESAVAMAEDCRSAGHDNLGARLGAWMAEAHGDGRDKLTLVASPQLAPFRLWVEQLVAESTGKQGKGLLPVFEEEPQLPTGYGPDRCVAVIRFEGDDRLAEWADAVSREAPVIELPLLGLEPLGGEFLRWEVGTALCGMLLGVNPFDEPDVTEAKKATAGILSGSLEPPRPVLEAEGSLVSYGWTQPNDVIAEDLASAVRPLVESIADGGYLAVLAYLPEDEELLAPLRDEIASLSRRTGIAMTLNLGPRYLHSTGQLHKGGPARGHFLVVTARDHADLDVPGRGFTLATLFAAQAEGDFVTLAERGRPVVRVDLPDASPERLAAFARSLEAAASAVRA